MFYVYKLLNPLKNNVPFYIGKGKDRRAYRHFQAIEWKESSSNPHKTRTLIQIRDAGLEPSIEIIPCDTEQDAFLLERQLIKQYGRSIDGGILTNICLGGEGNSSGQKRVCQYNLFRELIKIHDSLLDAAHYVGVNNSSSIVSACKKDGRARTPYGFVWCYEHDTPDWEYVFHKIKPVYQWDLNGQLVARYENLLKMFESTQFDTSTVVNFINKEAVCSYPYGFQFSHQPVFPNKTKVTSKKSKRVVCNETGITYDSCAQAERMFNDKKSSKNISTCARGNLNSAYGFTWSYI